MEIIQNTAYYLVIIDDKYLLIPVEDKKIFLKIWNFWAQNHEI